ncbi:heavy-metal-associated domain-containing protein [Microvenator marinus]|uniref:Heavy-metal-associated domain-containing protein n=1 Tax=Microvenator marinus TaxID=2600177 RepID=A0A5B8XMY6_9DELT|nr:heavy metal-associated domain-containing protein [Microvenator marinus]QED26368.1 heavy-metal-associated domain-containing protein [Microvenator marinus]
MELHVDGMTCGGCVRSVQRVIAKQTGIEAEKVTVDLESKSARFEGNPPDTEKLVEALKAAGFEAKPKG